MLCSALTHSVETKVVPILHTLPHYEEGGSGIFDRNCDKCPPRAAADIEEKDSELEFHTCVGLIWESIVPVGVHEEGVCVHALMKSHAYVKNCMMLVSRLLTVDHARAAFVAIEQSLMKHSYGTVPIGGGIGAYAGQFVDWVPYATFQLMRTSTDLEPDTAEKNPSTDRVLFGLAATSACVIVHAIGMSIRRQVARRRTHSHGHCVGLVQYRYAYSVANCKTWSEFDRLVGRISKSLTINEVVRAASSHAHVD